MSATQAATPETDAATCIIMDIMGACSESTNPVTSRKLERERDAALRELAELKAVVSTIKEESDGL